MKHQAHLAGAAALVGLLAAGADGRADSKQECADAYLQTQTLRERGKLLDARQKAVACSASTCSIHVTKDCIQWLAEIDASMPTVVLTATDPRGAETLAVRVAVDGQVIAEKLDGKAVRIDPGEHKARFDTAGAEPVEMKVLIRKGEKNRKLTASFKKAPRPPPSSLPASPPPPASTTPLPSPEQPAAPPEQPSAGVPVWAWVSGGIGVAALAVGAGFGIDGLIAHGKVVDECGGDPARCPVSTKDVTVPLADRRTLDRNAFIGLEAVAVVGITIAAIGIARAPSKKAAPATSWTVTPFASPLGGGVAMQGRF